MHTGTVFRCLKCGCLTSGAIFPEKGMDRRWCLGCNVPLVKCDHCFLFVSGVLIAPDQVKCGNCNMIVSAEALSIVEHYE